MNIQEGSPVRLIPTNIKSYLCPLDAGGFVLLLDKCSILYDPPTINLDELSDKASLQKPVIAVVTNKISLRNIEEFADIYTIVAPASLTLDTNILTRHIEEPLIITENTKLYFLFPRTINTERTFFVYTITKNFEFAYVTRPTLIYNPPRTDMIVLEYNTLKKIRQLADSPNDLPQFMGFDAQIVVVTHAPKPKEEAPFLYINNSCITIYRHLTELTAIII